MQASYTFSKNLTTLGAGDSSNSNDPLDQDQQYGPTGWNRPHRFILNYQYDLPFGTHQGAKGKLLNGWSITGITTIQDGPPLTFTDSSAGSSIYGASGGRAQMCAGATHDSIPTSGEIQDRLGEKRRPGYFNRGRILCTCQPVGSMAMAPVGAIPALVLLVVPASLTGIFRLSRDTKIREGHTFQFRTEFYNAFNHTQFANPDTGLAESRHVWTRLPPQA